MLARICARCHVEKRCCVSTPVWVLGQLGGVVLGERMTHKMLLGYLD